VDCGRLGRFICRKDSHYNSYIQFALNCLQEKIT
jgi:hypothetical protein